MILLQSKWHEMTICDASGCCLAQTRFKKRPAQGWIPSRCVRGNRSKRKWEILTCDSAASQNSIPLSQNGSKRPRNSTNPWWFTAGGKCGIDPQMAILMSKTLRGEKSWKPLRTDANKRRSCSNFLCLWGGAPKLRFWWGKCGKMMITLIVFWPSNSESQMPLFLVYDYANIFTLVDLLMSDVGLCSSECLPHDFAKLSPTSSMITYNFI